MSRILEATENTTDQAPPLQHLIQHWRDYYELTKPGVVALMVFTAVVGMLLASPGIIPWNALILGKSALPWPQVRRLPLIIWSTGRLTGA